MAERKQIPKKVRFEVFKRDRFTCQYCGAKAPDAILHVDHIVPVSKGGGNEITNLITACCDCNGGKGATLLSDDTEISLKRKQLEALEDRREQLEMMYEWELSLVDSENDELNTADALICKITGCGMSENGRKSMRQLISKFGISEVLESIRIAFTHYGFASDDDWELAFKKIGGICYNRSVRRCHQCAEVESRHFSEVVCKIHGDTDIESAENCADYNPWYGGDLK